MNFIERFKIKVSKNKLLSIKETRDFDYIRSVIEGRTEKSLSDNIRYNLLRDMLDVKEFVDIGKEILENNGLQSSVGDEVSLIPKLGTDYIKEVIEGNKIELSDEKKVRLIKENCGYEYKRSILEGNKGLVDDAIKLEVMKTMPIEYIKENITSKEEKFDWLDMRGKSALLSEVLGYSMNSYDVNGAMRDVLEVIRKLEVEAEKEDKIFLLESIQTFLENPGIQNIDENIKVELLKMQDSVYIKNFFKNEKQKDLSALNKVRLILQINNQEELNELLEGDQSISGAEYMKSLIKIFNAFGEEVFQNEEELFSEKANNVLGGKTLYDLVKYYKVPGEKIELDKVLEHGDEFNKYNMFRNNVFVQSQMEVMDNYNAIQEFNQNTELIVNCMSIDLEEEEKRILGVAIREKEVTLSGSGELKKFAQIRHEKIAEMSEKDQATYLLTGMKFDEYSEKVKKYFSEEQLNEIIEDFGADNPNFIKIKAINEMIDLISSLEPEKRKQVLEQLNNELMNEFTDKGSDIAGLRESFNGAEIQMKKIYGKELSQALNNFQLPKEELITENKLLEQYGETEFVKLDEVEQDGDVRLIKLEGQEFKLLVHGIDAYNALGNGTGKFESQEMGRTYICMSLISEKNMKTADAKCYYGFSDIGTNSLVMEGETNLYSNAKMNSLKVESYEKDKFETAEKVLENSAEKGGYNEIVLWREYMGDDGKVKKINPSYIVCFKSKGVNKNDIKEAKRLGIPIVLIDEEKYKEKTQTLEEKKTEEVVLEEVVVDEKTVETPNEADKTQELQPEQPEKEENKKIKVGDVYKEVMSKLAKIISPSKENEALQTIVTEMSKYKEQNKEAVAYEH